jgi:hypothetical protein
MDTDPETLQDSEYPAYQSVTDANQSQQPYSPFPICVHLCLSVVEKNRSGMARLEILRRSAMIAPCQSTNFIVGSAGATAKCWCDRRTGREPSVRIAARPSWTKNSRRSQRRARPPRRRTVAPVAVGAAAIAAVAAAGAIDFSAATGRDQRGQISRTSMRVTSCTVQSARWGSNSA